MVSLLEEHTVVTCPAFTHVRDYRTSTLSLSFVCFKSDPNIYSIESTSPPILHHNFVFNASGTLVVF